MNPREHTPPAMPRPPGSSGPRPGLIVAFIITALVAGLVGHFVGRPSTAPAGSASSPSAKALAASLRSYAAGKPGVTISRDGFTATFPQKPKRTSIVSGSGSTRSRITQYIDLNGPADFVVAVYRYSSPAQVPDLSATIQTVATGAHATVESAHAGTVQGLQAFSFVLTHGALRSRGFYVVRGSTLYQVQTNTTRSGYPGFARFVQSFSLQNSSSPSPSP